MLRTASFLPFQCRVFEPLQSARIVASRPVRKGAVLTTGSLAINCSSCAQIHNFFTAQEATLKSQLKSIRAELEMHEPSSPNGVELIKIRSVCDDSLLASPSIRRS